MVFTGQNLVFSMTLEMCFSHNAPDSGCPCSACFMGKTCDQSRGGGGCQRISACAIWCTDCQC